MNLISFEVSSSLTSTNLLFVYKKQFLTTLLEWLEVFDIYFTIRHFSPFTSLSIIVLVHKYFSGYCEKDKDDLQANI